MALDTRWKNPQGKDPEQLWRWAQDLTTELRRGEFFSTQIGSGITNAQLADMAAWTIKARNAGTAGDPQDVARGDLTAAAAPALAHELLGFLSTNELRRFGTGLVGGRQLLSFDTVTNAASLDIVLTAFTAYRGLRLVLANFVPATDDRELWMRLSTDGGSNYDAGAGNYSFSSLAMLQGAAAGEQGLGAATHLRIAGGSAGTQAVSNAAAEGGATVIVDLLNQTSTAIWPRVTARSAFVSASGVSAQTLMSGHRVTAQDTNAVRIIVEDTGGASNIVSGNWALYGYA